MKLQDLNIVIIGAGKIAYSIVDALHNIKLTPKLIISKKIKSAKTLANHYQIKNFATSFSAITSENNFFIIVVPDDEIKNVVSSLLKTRIDFTQKLFVHLSGVISKNIFNPLFKKGASGGSIHLMQTFPERKAFDIAGCYACIESSEINTEKLFYAFCNKLNLIPVKVSEPRKIFYHLAGVFASNFMIANFLIARNLLLKAGIKKKSVVPLLLPLAKSTLANIEKNGIIKALSGPLQRGDVETILKHLNALKKDKDIFKSYSVQSKILINELIKRLKK